MLLIDRRAVQFFDYGLLCVSLLIPCVGLVVLYSAGYDPEAQGVSLVLIADSIQSPPFIKQLGFFGIATVALFVGVLISPQKLYRYAYFFYALCIGLLLAVKLFGFVSHGAQRWLSFGGINLQPSELAKIALVLVLARYLSKTRIPSGGFGLKGLFVPGVLIALPMGLIVEQPDLGTALVVGSVGCFMLLFVGIRLKTLAIIGVSVIAVSLPAWSALQPYQQRRISSLFDPHSDPLGSGYHLTQSKIAVGSGALLGKGYLQGTQTQLQFLPEHHTDFIFSVLAEENGFLGSIFVILLYFILLALILRSVGRSKDLFGALLCFGVGSIIFFHAFVNIGMVVGILPVVGITLPLFSYGGSSLVVLMFALGLVLSVEMRRYEFVP